MKDMRMNIEMTIQTDDDITKDEILYTIMSMINKSVSIEYKDFIITGRDFKIKEF